MSLFTCNITNEKYQFMEYNLKDLAKTIQKQHQLTKQKILSFFKESLNHYTTTTKSRTVCNFDDAKKRGLIIKEYADDGLYDYIRYYFKTPYTCSLEEILNNIEEDFKNKDKTGKEFLKYIGSDEKASNYVGFYEKMTNLDEIKSRFERMYNAILQQYIDRKEYLDVKQKFDVSPIVINITEENKIQLIDGFKRLFIHNINNLDFIGVIKVYHNISDNSFIKILNATTDWTNHGKTCNGGYLFALEQRFGIGKEFFKLNSNYMLDEVSILNSYCSYIPNYVENGMYLEDLNTIKAILNTEFVVDDACILAKEIVLYTFKFISTYVRAKGDMTRYDFVEMFDDAMWKLKKKISSRKSIYVDGHIYNFITKEVYPKYIEYLKQKNNF